MTLDFLSAFMVGLLGSAHCVGMCGGIVTMLTSALPNQSKENLLQNNQLIYPTQKKSVNRILLLFCYHVGRIFSYSLLGFLVALSSSLAVKNLGFPVTALRIIAAIFLILLGLYLARWLMWLNYIESAGKIIWQRISPLSKKLIPVNSYPKSLFLGALWGWLPCGLVYSMLTWSLASYGAWHGAYLMFAFGLGTLPALITVSLGIQSVQKIINQPLFRKIMAILFIFYGIYTLIIALR